MTPDVILIFLIVMMLMSAMFAFVDTFAKYSVSIAKRQAHNHKRNRDGDTNQESEKEPIATVVLLLASHFI